MTNSKQPAAVAYVRGSGNVPRLMGEVRFVQHKAGVLVTTHITGLPLSSESGFFALHIHEGNHCSGTAFADTGGHYNPVGVPHPRHAGDLPPLLSCHGEAYSSVLTDRFALEDILGRTVVIHDGADDFRTQPAGNAGAKIACGVIHSL